MASIKDQRLVRERVSPGSDESFMLDPRCHVHAETNTTSVWICAHINVADGSCGQIRSKSVAYFMHRALVIAL